MSEQTLLQTLGAMVTDTRWQELPAELRDGLGARILDVLGVAAAATPLETSRAVLDYAGDLGGRPEATAIGSSRLTSAPTAAFVNGVLAHSLDFDDTHLPSIVHPSASVVPAALAVAEGRDASGPELLTAIATGLEVTVRLGMAGYRQGTDDVPGQSIYFEHGQHATSICGAIGSAAAAARLLGLGPDGTAHALAVSCSMASGIIEANRTGGTVKRLHCGWAAQAGVTAALLASRGITGAPTALEGRFGLFQALLRDEWSAEPVTDRLGDHWEAASIAYKPYPANHFAHTAIDAALELREAGIRPADVASAHLAVATATVRTIGDPLHLKQRPENGYQAQFSGPFMVAAGLRGGSGLGLGLRDFSDEAANDPELRSVMEKVTVGGSELCDSIYPHQFPAVLTVRTTDGRDLEVAVLENRGSAARPLGPDELRAKFQDNVHGLIGRDAATAMAEASTELQQAPAGAGALGELLAPARRLGVLLESEDADVAAGAGAPMDTPTVVAR